METKFMGSVKRKNWIDLTNFLNTLINSQFSRNDWKIPKLSDFSSFVNFKNNDFVKWFVAVLLDV